MVLSHDCCHLQHRRVELLRVFLFLSKQSVSEQQGRGLYGWTKGD